MLLPNCYCSRIVLPSRRNEINEAWLSACTQSCVPVERCVQPCSTFHRNALACPSTTSNSCFTRSRMFLTPSLNGPRLAKPGSLEVPRIVTIHFSTHPWLLNHDFLRTLFPSRVEVKSHGPNDIVILLSELAHVEVALLYFLSWLGHNTK